MWKIDGQKNQSYFETALKEFSLAMRSMRLDRSRRFSDTSRAFVKPHENFSVVVTGIKPPVDRVTMDIHGVSRDRASAVLTHRFLISRSTSEPHLDSGPCS